MSTSSRRLSMLAFILTLFSLYYFFVPTRFSSTHKQLEHQAVLPAISKPHDPAADSIAESITMKRGIAERQVGEADTTFLKRVLPFSYPKSEDLVAYAWRPSAFGSQLFFSVRGTGDNEYGTDLFVLDPFQAGTYSIQVLKLESMGDLTNLASLFFADVDQNGRKELLALLVCSLRETIKSDDGELLQGHWDHYQTAVFQYLNLGNTGRPQYRLDSIPRNHLDELPTASAVRQAIARHQRKLTQSKLSTTSRKRK